MNAHTHMRPLRRVRRRPAWLAALADAASDALRLRRERARAARTIDREGRPPLGLSEHMMRDIGLSPSAPPSRPGSPRPWL